mmetsp:Transcript_29149/g.86250  ORF Transcript_29149/g.86250 Transcript_29149/m.86250 type:complete len:251 (-) Transcript_29149:889-1641(-)
MTSSILRIMRTTCVASMSCCCLPMSVSNTFCSFMSLVPAWLQSMPRYDRPLDTWSALTDATVSIGCSPEFSASAHGVCSSASANARIAYCSMVPTWSAASDTLSEHAISDAPPPYTIRLSRIRLRTTQIASCSERFASSRTIRLPPRQKTVTAREFGQPSITIIRSFVVPNASSCTWPAEPSLSAVSSAKRGTMRASVAMAISSSSTPPTHRMAGSSFCISKWFASSSKPHWQMTRLAPASFTCRIICVK